MNYLERYVLSLGAGVQSSALALMLDNKDIDYPKPEFAVFADTQAEPKEVYEWLEWLKSVLSYPIYTCTKGNLYDISLKLFKTETTTYTKATIPAYIIGKQGKKGLLMRQCTPTYKIEPIKREIRKHIKLSRKHILGQYIGISADESSRMKDSRDVRIKNIYPLVELGFNRSDCKRYIKEKYGKIAPRSACIFCPFHNDAEWQRLFENPETVKLIIDYEKQMQETYSKVTNFRGKPFLHNSLQHIETMPFENQTMNLFINECEGYCGV